MYTRRFTEREFQWMDLMGRFENRSFSEHHREALGMIGGLEHEGTRFWDRGSQEFQKWRRCCTALREFLNSIRRRRDSKGQPLETAMREFFQEFEHSTGRMYQLMYSTDADTERDERIREIINRFNIVYLTSTYALVSAWIDDKQDRNTRTTLVDLTTGEVKQEGTLTRMQVPKKYRKSTRRI